MLIIYGAGVLSGQVLILREVLVLCRGQELKLALGLWAWLACTGMGSLLGGRLTWWADWDFRALARLLALLGVLLPGTVFMARLWPTMMALPPGHAWTPGVTLLLVLLLVAPFALVSGAFFPLACQTLRGVSPQMEGAGWVYALETLGAALGICLVQIFLAGRWASLAVGLGVGGSLVMAAAILSRPATLLGRGAYAATLSGFLLLLINYSSLDNLAYRQAFPSQEIMAVVDSPYARLSATQEGEQISFFVNHVWQFTVPDPYHAEQAVHLGLAQHPNPRRVLLLGGGVAGLAPEIFKVGSVTAVDYVELDPELVRLVQRLLPAHGGGLAGNQRLKVIYQDGRRFLGQTEATYDVILMTLPEPASAQLNRFYTWEFFHLVARRLSPQGVFSFSLPGADASLNPWRVAYLALIFNTLRQVFPEVVVWPGDRLRFFAAPSPGVLLREPEALLSRLQERGVELQFVRDYYLLADVSQPRRQYVEALLSRVPVEINTDFNPRSYFYDLALTGTKEGLPLRDWLHTLKNLPSCYLWGVGLGLAVLLLLVVPRSPGVLYVTQVAGMGLGVMGLEIVLLILYQIYWGSLYRQLGLLMAAFMAGMGLGSLGGVAVTACREARPWHLAALQAVLAGLVLFTWAFFSGVAFTSGPGREWVALTGYLGLLALAGGAGGAVFTLSARLWSHSRPAAAWRDGALYAADLAGATVGTLGLSLVVIPVWGLIPSLLMVAAVHGWGALAALSFAIYEVHR